MPMVEKPSQGSAQPTRSGGDVAVAYGGDELSADAMPRLAVESEPPEPALIAQTAARPHVWPPSPMVRPTGGDLVGFTLSIEERGIQIEGQAPKDPIRGQGLFTTTVLGPTLRGRWLEDAIVGSMAFDLASVSFTRLLTQRVYQGERKPPDTAGEIRWEGAFGRLFDTDLFGTPTKTLLAEGFWVATTTDSKIFDGACDGSPRELCDLLIGRWEITADNPQLPIHLAITSAIPNPTHAGTQTQTLRLAGELLFSDGSTGSFCELPGVDPQSNFDPDRSELYIQFSFAGQTGCDHVMIGTLTPGERPTGSGIFEGAPPANWTAKKIIYYGGGQ